MSSVIIICAIIVVSQLVRLSSYLVTLGLTLENLVLPFLYIIAPFLSITIPMAILAGALITMARASADAELTALMAAGYSLRKAAGPFLAVGLMGYGLGAYSACNLEAWGRRELVQFIYRKSQTELDNLIRFKLREGVFQDNFLGYVLYAEKISADRSKFQNVMLAPGRDLGDQNFTLLAPSGQIRGSVEDGFLKFTLDQGIVYSNATDSDRSSVLRFRKAEIDILKIFQKQILGPDSAEDDYRSYRLTELSAFLDKLAADPNRDQKTYSRAQYLFYSRFASPFAAVTFTIFALVFGITDQRRGRNMVFFGGVAVLMVGYLLITLGQWSAHNGYLPPLVAACLPNAILLLFGGFALYQKNRLPPSESILAWSNLPFTSPR